MPGHQGGVVGPGARIGGFRHREPGHVDREPERGLTRIQQDKYPGVVRGSLEGDGFVGQVLDGRPRPDQPRVAAAEADEALVQPVDRPAIGRQLSRAGREGRADLVVTAGPVFLMPRNACSSP